ncbi:unnamed protein product [Durusdinium trenchii]|uniref:Uncharacterized protein n=1 Tax=Durusdinium trenchii TaxID=1381693 RepID=A0ABP0PB74_9DINO
MALACNARQLSFRTDAASTTGSWFSCFDLHAEAPKQVSRRPVANEADQWVSDFVEAVPQLRVFPTEETIGSEWLGAETARVVLALKERLESSPRDSWQVQARMLRVILSAFQQPFLGRISSAALTGRAQELLKQFRSSEVLELREEAARLWQLLELSWSMPNENPWRLALQGGLLAFTENAKAAPPEARRSLTSGAERGAEDLLDLRSAPQLPASPKEDLSPPKAPPRTAAPIGEPFLAPVPVARSTCAEGGKGTDLIWQKSPERFQLSLDEEDCGNQDLERMYSFARPAPKHIPYFPPSTQVKMLTEQDPFDFVSEQVKQMRHL